MTPRQRAALAVEAYEATGSLAGAAHVLRTETHLRGYTERRAAFDLWYAVRRGRARAVHHYEAASALGSGYGAVYQHVLSRALMDLQAGAPCTLGIGMRGFWPSASTVCSVSVDSSGSPVECHCCAPDAFAWLTSLEFHRLCQKLDWPWRRVVETVLAEAAQTAQLFPWVALAPALVWRVACVLEGEAGVLGPEGMWYVGDTMLSRRALGQSWETVLSAYYAYQEPPSEGAMTLAEQMLTHPWEASGRQFAYSEQDRQRQGWRAGEIVYRRGNWILHLATVWPGAEMPAGAIAQSSGISVR